jgi:hypothetical protein
MSTITFDPDRDYGEIYGEPVSVVRETEDGEVTVVAVFEQDGFHFDAQQQFIPELMTPALKKKLERRLAEKKAAENARAAYEAAMADAGLKVDGKAVTITDPNANKEQGEIDLAAWAQGRVKVRFDLVAKQIRQTFDIGVTSKEQAKEVLQLKGIIPDQGGAMSIGVLSV